MFSVLASVKVDDPLLRVRIAAAEKAARDADLRALAADDRAANAQQMVRNDRPKLATLEQQQTSLEQLAATLGAAVPASEKVHADLWAAITALQSQTLAGQVKQFRVTLGVSINATGTVTVTWDQPMASTAYLPLLLPPTPVTDVTVTSKTTTGVTFTYKTGALAISIGAVFNVVGIALTK